MPDRSPATVLLWLVAAVLCVLVVMRLAGNGEASEGAPVRVDGPRARSGSNARGLPGIYVHVAGAVRRPGLVRVADGARVARAVARAGGAARGADLHAVNLAARLADGQQVVVPARAGAPAAGAAGTGAAGAGAKLSLGMATAEQLEGLDGIGPALAGRIVEYRTEHGGFRSLADLGEIEGIGEKRLASLRDAVQP